MGGEFERLTGGVRMARELLAERRRQTMTPKLQGMAHRMKMLQHNLETDAAKLDARITETELRSKKVFDKSHQTVDGAHANLTEIDKVLDAIEGSNSGVPISRESSNGSEAPRSSEIATKR